MRAYAMTEEDCLKIIPSLRILMYPELENYRTIDEALDEKGRLLILYLTENETTGHWVCLLKKDNIIEYFDSYGNFKPDGEATWLTKEKLRRFKQDKGTLTKLLVESPYDIYYNKRHFQSKEDDVATCGKHCMTRLYLKHLNLPEYYQLMDDQPLSPDDFVCRFIYNLIHK